MPVVTRDKPRDGYASTRYEESAEHRERILQYLHEHPGATLSHISWALRLTNSRASQTLLRMWFLKEIRYDDHGVSLRGRKCRAYYAVAEHTTSADAMRDRVVDNLYGEGSGRTRRPQTLPQHNGVRRLFGGLDV